MSERLRNQERTRFHYFLEHRLSKTAIPPWFSSANLLPRFQEIDGQPAHRELAQKIDEDTLRLQDLGSREDLNEDVSDLLRRGTASLRKETRILRNRFQLLSEQRRRKQLWVIQCMLLGDIPVDLASETIRSYLWEMTQMEVCQSLIIPKFEEEAHLAESRREQDQCVRRMRQTVNALAILADRTLDARESFALTLDLWNSPTVEVVGTNKGWKKAPLRKEDVASSLVELRESTNALASELSRRYGKEAPAGLLNLGPEMATLGRSLLETAAEGPAA